MKPIFKLKKAFKARILTFLGLIVIGALSSCDFEYDLPEANSKADATAPVAGFSASVTSEYLTWTFGNTSSSATDYFWDFGDGTTAITKDAEHTFPDEGIYTVTLTVSDKLNVTSTYTTTIEVIEPEVPLAITPNIINGDFTLGTEGWFITNDSGNFPFNTSSDGAPFDIDGNALDAKTAGAKYTSSTSVGPRTATSRNGYQAITVSPNTDYVLTYMYAIKVGAAHAEGNQVIVDVLDGWYAHENDIINSTKAPLGKGIGDLVLDKGNFTTVTVPFTTGASGEVSIFFYSKTAVDSYIDNIVVKPVM